MAETTDIIQPGPDLSLYPVEVEIGRPLCEGPRTVPKVDDLPAKIDALIVPGMGPVLPALVGAEEKRRVIAQSQLMRHNTIAAAELVAKGKLGKEGVIIVSGKQTAKNDDVIQALAQKQEANPSAASFRSEMKNPGSPKEADQVLNTTEAELMRNLVTHVVPKSGEKKPVTPERVIEEPLAPNSINNLFEAINALDATVEGDRIWQGNLGIITSEFGHLARNKEILNAIGFTDDRLVPLEAQEVLQQSGYDQLYSDYWKQQMESYKGDQERWRRGIREKPVYLITQLDAVRKPERLMQIMRGLRQWYGQETLNKYGLGNFDNMTREQIIEQATSFNREAPENWPPENWNPGDLNAQEQEIQRYKVLTQQWLQL